MERATGIEPAWLAWKASAQPLSHTRTGGQGRGRTAVLLLFRQALMPAELPDQMRGSYLELMPVMPGLSRHAVFAPGMCQTGMQSLGSSATSRRRDTRTRTAGLLVPGQVRCHCAMPRGGADGLPPPLDHLPGHTRLRTGRSQGQITVPYHTPHRTRVREFAGSSSPVRTGPVGLAGFEPAASCSPSTRACHAAPQPAAPAAGQQPARPNAGVALSSQRASRLLPGGSYSVGLRRFELLASASRTRRAAKLRYNPCMAPGFSGTAPGRAIRFGRPGEDLTLNP